MRITHLLGASILAVSLLSADVAPAGAVDVALPAEINIVSPDPSVPEAIRRFHGTWSGQWDSVLDHKLIVETVDAAGIANVVYAWGDYPRWQVQRDWIRTTAKIKDNIMRLKRAGHDVEYVFRDDGALGGTYDSGYHRNYGTFIKE